MSAPINEKALAGSVNKKKTKIGTIPIVILLFALYIVVAMGDNFKGIFVPFFKEDFHINNVQIGYIMTASLFAYAVFQYVGGLLIERFGYKKILIVGFIVSFIALGVLVYAPSYMVLVLGMFLLNIGMAMFNINVNTLGPILPVASTAVLMSGINAAYGAFNTVLQLISGKLLSTGIHWKIFFLFMLGICVALLIYLLSIKIPYEPAKKSENTGQKELFKNPMLYLYIGAVGFYLAAEYGIGNWFVNYMNESFGLTAEKTALYMALFFGAKTIGLLFGGFMADKLGYFRCIFIYGLFAVVMSTVGIVLGENGLVLFSLGGLAFSAIFPTLITTIPGTFKKSASSATGLILMFGILIAMAGNFIIGVLNDALTARYAFFVIPIVLILTTIFSQLIGKKLKKQST